MITITYVLNKCAGSFRAPSICDIDLSVSGTYAKYYYRLIKLTDSFGFGGDFFYIFQLKHIFLEERKIILNNIIFQSLRAIRELCQTWSQLNIQNLNEFIFKGECEIMRTYGFKKYFHHTTSFLFQAKSFFLRLWIIKDKAFVPTR